jgi:hypothetical protein
MEVNGQLQGPVALPPKKELQYPVGGPQSVTNIYKSKIILFQNRDISLLAFKD